MQSINHFTSGPGPVLDIGFTEIHLPRHKKAEARRKKIVNMIMLSIFIVSAAICYFQYHRLNVELHIHQERVATLIRKSENYIARSGHSGVNAEKLANNIRFNVFSEKRYL